MIYSFSNFYCMLYTRLQYTISFFNNSFLNARKWQRFISFFRKARRHRSDLRDFCGTTCKTSDQRVSDQASRELPGCRAWLWRWCAAWHFLYKTWKIVCRMAFSIKPLFNRNRETATISINRQNENLKNNISSMNKIQIRKPKEPNKRNKTRTI